MNKYIMIPSKAFNGMYMVVNGYTGVLYQDNMTFIMASDLISKLNGPH